jgi:1-aminocyclopropane-1-carboxylate deaminase
MVKTLISEDEFLHKSRGVTIQPLNWELAIAKGIEVLVRRDDLVDAACSGNKFYKLFYSLQAARVAGYTKLLSFGGPYSNHLYALAAAGARYGFNTVGVIRGERPKEMSETLVDAERWGMKLHFVSREQYRLATGLWAGLEASELKEILSKAHGDFYLIPEGGAEGVRGTAVMGWAIKQQLGEMPARQTQVCLACGTGNTLAGIAAGMAGSEACVAGFSVLKGEGDLGRRIIDQQNVIASLTGNWRLISGYHGGGYGKRLPAMIHGFGRDFESATGLKLDPVYTLKMVWGVAQLMQQNYWQKDSRLLLIHTGGLQGRRGFDY